MSLFKAAAALSAALAALPGAVSAGSLTFDAALAQAARNAPSLRARGLAIDTRRSAAVAAGQLPDPKLGLRIENFPVSGPPAFTFDGEPMTMTRLGVTQDVPNLAKRRAARGRAAADVAIGEAQAAVEDRRVRIATAVAWIDLAFAGQRGAAIDDVLARLTRVAAAAASGVAAGSVRPAQALDIRQAIAALEDKRSEIAAETARARAALARWTGDPAPEPEGAVPAFAIDPAALRAAVDRHPDLAATIARTGRAEADIVAARAEKRPDWSFDIGYGRRAERYGDMISAGVTASLPLFAKRRQDPMIAAAVAEKGTALAEQEDMRRALFADLEAGLADHVMHHEQWMRAERTLLPLARQRADLETASYAAGRASLTELIAAQTALAQASLDTLDRAAIVARDAARLVLTYGSDDR